MIAEAAGVHSELIDRILDAAPDGMLSLVFCDGFDQLTAVNLLDISMHDFAALMVNNHWPIVFQRLTERLWEPRPLVRGPLRARLAETGSSVYTQAIQRMIDLAIGDQLVDPAALASWACRYSSNTVGLSALFALAIEEPELVCDSIALIRNHATLPTYRATSLRLRSAAAGWKDLFEVLSATADPFHVKPYARLIRLIEEAPAPLPTDFGGSAEASSQEFFFSYLDSASSSFISSYRWPTVALVSQEITSNASLSWNPIVVSRDVTDLTYQRQELRSGVSEGTSGFDLVPYEPSEPGSRAAEFELWHHWWWDPDIQTVFRDTDEDIQALLHSALFSSGEVEKVTHQVTIVNSASLKRRSVFRLRIGDAPETRSGASRYLVLWQLPDGVRDATDLRVVGADGLPLAGPDKAHMARIRRALTRLIEPTPPSTDATKTLWGGQPISAVWYRRLERLVSESWRIVPLPHTRAEIEVTAEWTERIPLALGRWRLRNALSGNVDVSVHGAAFSLDEELQIHIQTTSDLEVTQSELRVPSRSSQLVLPREFADSTVVAKLRLSKSALLVAVVLPIAAGLIGLVSSVVGTALGNDRPIAFGSMASVAGILALFGIASGLKELQRVLNSANWALTQLRWITGSVALVIALSVLSLAPFGSAWTWLVRLPSIVGGGLLLGLGISAAILAGRGRKTPKETAPPLSANSDGPTQPSEPYKERP